MVYSTVKAYKPADPVQLPLSKDSGYDREYISLDRLIEDHIPEIQDNTWFWNSPLLFNGHLQTMYAAAGNFENVDQIYYGRRLLTWDNGATVSVDHVINTPTSKTEWEEALKYKPTDNLPKFPSRTRYLTPEEIIKFENPNETRPLLITLHGLTGGSHESYVRATINQLIFKAGSRFECLVLTSRGCNRTKITTPQLFCGAATEDIRNFVNRIREIQPNRKIYAVGYSLGASMLANYLGQEGSDIQLEGACCVANPWDLNVSSIELQNTYIGRNLYSPTMTKNLLRLVKNHKDVLSNNEHFVRALNKPSPRTLPEFDDLYTAPFFGFDSSSDYYRLGSSVHRLTSIRTPTLILNSLDDPVVSELGIPYAEAKVNPYTYLVTTSVGGHLGWFEPGGKRWFAGVIADYFITLDNNVSTVKNAVASLDHLPKRKWNVDRHIL
ncbi:putative carboxylic ester hydrolase [Sugiyamaella lignohabitans]|uniref:Putative carboxylic ester hydrolase n=1 Tax=Sugiyamaella lignohabitans TaxID=796027 RepID=A0A167F598_9ASCO|nr:putative carboxylic ester hydrolase [Sugiyamaella lignohabitans]ANB14843.1 putative carboxylic ester hydrolase [Sugiyamaella lignohabitans]